MAPLIRVIKLPGWSIFRQLKFEEFLLRTKEENFLLVNQGIPQRSIVMGFSAKPENLLQLDAVRRDKVEVLRRFTGGGTVIVDRNTYFVSFIMNAADVPCPAYPRDIMSWTETIYQPVFQALLPSDVPKFALREHDYVLGERKIGGNAQSITKGRWIHHTSFLWDFAPENMNYLQMPAKRPAYRSDRSHHDFLLPMCRHLPSTESFSQQLVSSLQRDHLVEFMSEEEVQGYSDLEKVFASFNDEMDRLDKTKFVPRTVCEEV